MTPEEKRKEMKKFVDFCNKNKIAFIINADFEGEKGIETFFSTNMSMNAKIGFSKLFNRTMEQVLEEASKKYVSNQLGNIKSDYM